MLGIRDAVETIGFRSIGVKITLEQLIDDVPLLCILHWNQNHFVVCYKIKKRKNGNSQFYIADPGSRKIVCDEETMKKCWVSTHSGGKSCGTALMLSVSRKFKTPKTSISPKFERGAIIKKASFRVSSAAC